MVEDIECSERNEDALGAAQIPECFSTVVPAGTANDFNFETPGPVSSTDPAQVGVWTSVVDNEMRMPVHAIHRPTGKVLTFGLRGTGADRYRTDKAIWALPAPCVDPAGAGIGSCDVSFDIDPITAGVQSHWEVFDGDPDMTEFNLFCAGHVNLPPEVPEELDYPRTLTAGGSNTGDANQGSPGAFVFWESLPDSGASQAGDYDWTEVADLEFYRWYPTTTVLADGRVAATGGTFQNNSNWVECSTDGVTALVGGECNCVQMSGDFWDALNICGNDGICDPDAAEVTNLPDGAYCNVIEDGTQGLDLGQRSAAVNPPLLDPSDDIIDWSFVPTGFWQQYPQMFVVPDLPHLADSHLGGTLIKVGSDEGVFPTGVDGTLRWDPADPGADPVSFGGVSCARGSSSVMYASDKILKFGGLNGVAGLCLSTRISEVFDLSTACPHWRPAGPTASPKRYSGGVLLPDGTVVASGGTAADGNRGDVDLNEFQYLCEGDWDANTTDLSELALSTTELFQPSNAPEPALAGQWCRLADMPFDSPYRGYHSQSFLLPDGRVYLGAGGNTGGGAVDHFDYAIFAPPNLFWGPRPDVMFDPMDTVNDIGWMVAGGADMPLIDAGTAPIDRITLIKLASATHNFDMEQRLVELQFSQTASGGLQVTPPPSTCYATPGYYMLFAISDAGVPSIGQYVAVTGSCAEAQQPAVAPLVSLPPPKAINDVLAGGSAGLRASCGPPGSTLDFSDFGRDLLELCTATHACPSNSTIDVELRLKSSTGQGTAVPGQLLDTATVKIVDGAPNFVGNGITLDVAGHTYANDAALGPGDHVLQLCGSIGALVGCTEQPLRVDAVLGSDGLDEMQAARVERSDLSLSALAPGPGLRLTGDDVAEIALPEGVVFPFYGTLHDTIWVGANGAVRLDAGPIPPSNGPLPQVGGPHIAVFWDDLEPGAGGMIRTYFDGFRYVVSWEGVPIVSGGRVSAQLHLFADGRIEMHYRNVDEGVFAFGASATIGIQDGTQALALSVNDAALLAGGDAFAFDATDCVASALRLPDTMACHDSAATATVDVAICGGTGTLRLSPQRVPTMCEAHRDAHVRGTVWLGADRQPVAQDGAIEVHVADYETEWVTRAPTLAAYGERWRNVGKSATQLLRVRESDDEDVCCDPTQAVVVLTARDDDQWVGKKSPVCAAAQSGNDTLQAYGYDDTLLGHAGNDRLEGNGGDDLLVGGIGDDRLLGGPGIDILQGGAGADILLGDDDADTLWGGTGADQLVGGRGADILLPGAGLDTVDGGDGDDEVVVLDLCEVVSGETLDGGSGTDTLWLPVGATLADVQGAGATVTGFEIIQTLTGGAWGTAECAL